MDTSLAKVKCLTLIPPYFYKLVFLSYTILFGGTMWIWKYLNIFRLDNFKSPNYIICTHFHIKICNYEGFLIVNANCSIWGKVEVASPPLYERMQKASRCWIMALARSWVCLLSFCVLAKWHVQKQNPLNVKCVLFLMTKHYSAAAIYIRNLHCVWVLWTKGNEQKNLTQLGLLIFLNMHSEERSDCLQCSILTFLLISFCR